MRVVVASPPAGPQRPDTIGASPNRPFTTIDPIAWDLWPIETCATSTQGGEGPGGDRGGRRPVLG